MLPRDTHAGDLLLSLAAGGDAGQVLQCLCCCSKSTWHWYVCTMQSVPSGLRLLCPEGIGNSTTQLALLAFTAS